MSRTSTQNLELVIRARRDAASFQTAGTQVRQDLRRMERGGEREGGIRGFVENLNQRVGRGAAFTHLLHAAEGGGAALGLTLAARSIGEVSDKARELSKQLSESKMDAAGLAVELGKSLPFIGSFVEAGQKVRGLLTGEADEIERINAEAKIMDLATEARVHVLEKSRDLYREMADQMERLRNEAEGAGKTGFAKELLESQAGGREFARSQMEAQREYEKDLRSNQAKALSEINKTAMETAPSVFSRFLGSLQGAAKSGYANTLTLGLSGFAARHMAFDPSEEEARHQAFLQHAAQQAGGLSTQTNQEAALSRYNRGVLLYQAGLRQDAIAREAQRRAGVEDREKLFQSQQQNAAQFTELGSQAAARAGHLPEFMRGQIEANRQRSQETLQEELANRLDEIQRSGGASPEYIQQVKEAAEQQAKLIDLKAKIDQQKNDDEADLNREKALNALRRERMTYLEQEAAAGSKAAQAEKERLQIEDQFAQRRQQLMEMLRTAHADRRPAIQAALNALGGEEASAQQGRVGLSFRGLAQSMLQGMAGGNPAVQRLLRRHEVSQQFDEHERQLRAILNDPNATPEQRAMAQQSLSILPGMRTHAMAAAGLGGVQAAPFASTMFNVGGRLSGASLAAREAALNVYKSPENDQVALTKKLVDMVDQITKTMREQHERSVVRDLSTNTPPSFLQ